MKIERLLFIYYPLVLLVFLSCHLFAQDPGRYLDELKIRIDKIEDYQVDMEIEVDVDFIRMPIKRATVFFKQPDKVKYKSDDFIMIPKVGADFLVNKILNTSYTAIFNNFDPAIPHLMVAQVLPRGKDPDLILATLWIDTLTIQIARMEVFTRKEGNFTIDLTYEGDMLLPQMLTISFEIDPMNVPLNLTIGNMVDIDQELLEKSEPNTGKVYIRFSNYKINTGVEDSFFRNQNGR